MASNVSNGRFIGRNYGFREYLIDKVILRVFSNSGWPEWLGGILLGIVNILFVVWALKPFTIYTGYLNWGQSLYSAIGIQVFGLPKAFPLFEKTSVGDIGLFIGAFLAALLSNEFRLRMPNSRLDYVEAVIGGLLMALGVVFARGCNWGGFFSAITVLSLHGYLMFIGLLLGGVLGSMYVKWRVNYDARRLELELESPNSINTISSNLRAQKIVATVLIALLMSYILTMFAMNPSGDLYLGILLLGILVGLIIQRSRFCFATAFRDIIHGGGEFHRSVRLQIGIVLGILVSSTGVFVLKYQGLIDPMLYVKSSSIFNVLGGILFGLGMVIAGGCASGSLWRAAEGHVKLWIALIASILSYPIFKTIIESSIPWIHGLKISLINILGWGGTILFVYISMLAWTTIVLYLEYRRVKENG